MSKIHGSISQIFHKYFIDMEKNMLNKFAFLCVNPWEKFLPAAFQSYSRNYYQWVKEAANYKNIDMNCREFIDIYGTSGCWDNQEVFYEDREKVQLVYVQSDRRELLEKVFLEADMVIMGLPGSRKEFDKIYMTVFPWKDEILFLWGKHISRDEKYVDRLVRECMLRKEQLIKMDGENWNVPAIEKAPAF